MDYPTVVVRSLFRWGVATLRDLVFRARPVGLALLLVAGSGVLHAESPAAAPVVDRAEERRALGAEEARLTALYSQLQSRRQAIAPGDPGALESYNRAVADYTRDLAALKIRQENLKRVATPGPGASVTMPPAEQRARDLYTRFQKAIGAGDWKTQTTCMEEALSTHRGAKVFPAISALAHTQLAAATRESVAGAGPAAGAAAAPLLAQLRAIINQPLQPVGRSKEKVGTYNFHVNPGLAPLNYAKVTREQLWSARHTFPEPLLEPRAHPGTFYRTEDVEFNLLLKHYYADQTFPTRRLTEADYDRIVSICQEIARAQPAAPSAPSTGLWERIETLRNNWPK